LAPGVAAVAAIRPDDVEIGHAGGGANRFRGKVEIVEYLGRENEAVVALEAGPRVWMRTPLSLAPEEPVTVTFPAEKVIFLPPEPAV
jgi:putative spermidine/putrescine transport system ATP-binding protein